MIVDCSILLIFLNIEDIKSNTNTIFERITF